MCMQKWQGIESRGGGGVEDQRIYPINQNLYSLFTPFNTQEWTNPPPPPLPGLYSSPGANIKMGMAA